VKVWIVSPRYIYDKSSGRLLLDLFCVTISIRLASSENRFSTYRPKPLQGHMMNKLRLIAYVSFIAIFTTACSSGDGGTGSDSDNDDSTPIEVIPSPTMAKEILFSEIMVEPTLPVNLGEWFEIQNPGADKLNLRDCVFEDDGSGNFSINSDLIIEPGGYMTFAISANQVFFPDIIYQGTGLTLNSPADTLYLTCNGIAIDSRNYTFTNKGRSSGLSNDGNGMWCDELVERYNSTDKGTPGAANRNC
jgi:hypothetical protein